MPKVVRKKRRMRGRGPEEEAAQRVFNRPGKEKPTGRNTFSGANIWAALTDPRAVKIMAGTTAALAGVTGAAVAYDRANGPQWDNVVERSHLGERGNVVTDSGRRSGLHDDIYIDPKQPMPTGPRGEGERWQWKYENKTNAPGFPSYHEGHPRNPKPSGFEDSTFPTDYSWEHRVKNPFPAYSADEMLKSRGLDGTGRRRRPAPRRRRR